ncbi:arylesterase [Paracoccus sp. Z118]|uniref:arylesterase n=1 Tax=Paracoccus sp. Z118 TaxID=2851017 RepID=UPI001C2BD4DE|nr:arylesterase [Paracoccus sp. Z118]MBV0893264.1 arylesterase [Paracoccus sp. Z118]
MLARLLAITILSALPAAAQPVTVAALGDSLTQGYGLPQEAGLVPQLQTWLRERGADVTLINAGVSGDTTAGGLSRVEWTLTPEVDGLIVALGGNDLLRGIDPAVSRANLAGILEAARDADIGAMLIGIEAPPNYGEDYRAAFNAIYTDVAAAHDVPAIPSMLAPIVAAPEPLALMQPDAIHPNAEGVRVIVEGIGPEVLAFVDSLGACEGGCIAEQ